MFSHWVEMIPKEKKIMDIYPSIFFKVPYHCLFRNQIKKERSNCLVKRYDGPILITLILYALACTGANHALHFMGSRAQYILR